MSRLLCVIAILALAPLAGAHEVRPAYLELRQTAAASYDVLWKVPGLGDERRLGIYVEMPAGTLNVTEPRGVFVNGAYSERWKVTRPGGLEGATIGISGLQSIATDVLVRIERLDGTTTTVRLTPAAPSFVVEASPGRLAVAGTYLVLGIEHILLGVDHLLFVLALVILVRGGRRLVATITAFTVAHSITLAGATLGVLHVPGPPVEASIALSIMFVAAEIVRARRGESGLTQRWPWLVAFTFGLLHGFGFAGALSEVGLPPTAIPVALLFFNVGVEAGQLLFIGAVFAMIAAARRLRFELPAWLWPYAIGTTAAFWVIQRVSVF